LLTNFGDPKFYQLNISQFGQTGTIYFFIFKVLGKFSKFCSRANPAAHLLYARGRGRRLKKKQMRKQKKRKLQNKLPQFWSRLSKLNLMKSLRPRCRRSTDDEKM
jgi:hypothetical protein